MKLAAMKAQANSAIALTMPMAKMLMPFVGDPQRLLDFLGKHYGFHQFQNGNARVTTYRARYRYTGSLKVTPAEVLDKNFASTNYRIELSVER